jgi:hypothetical protein
MFAAQIARAAAATVGCRFAPTVARCDAAVDDGGFEEGTFAGGASSSEPEATLRFRPPMIYENLAGTLRQGSVNNYDGFRVAVQKQVNLNTVVSHFYWVGSQAAPPIYQYRIILPFEDGKTINAATDMDFNIECELRAPLGRGANAKTNFAMHDQQGNTVSFDVDVTDESSATQFVYSPTAGSLAMSYMQSIGKSLLLGGEGQYTIKDNSVKMSFGATYDDKENLLAAQWDTSVSPPLSPFPLSLPTTIIGAGIRISRIAIP